MADNPRTRIEFDNALSTAQEAWRQQMQDDAYASRESARLRYIEFRRSVEIEWVPAIEQYLGVLGELWFGKKMVLTGASGFAGKLVERPAYTVAHDFYASMAVFWVAEDTWREREVEYDKSDSQVRMRIEVFNQGFRCRLILEDTGALLFQTDDGETKIRANPAESLSPALLQNQFAEAFAAGPRDIHRKWKDPFELAVPTASDAKYADT